MTKKTKIIRIIATVSAVALLCGGVYLLVKNDVSQKIKGQDVLPYSPTPIAKEVLENAVDITENKPSADNIPSDIKDELTAQVQNLSVEFEDSIAWLYVPNTNINYPIMQSADNEYYLHRATDGSYLYAGSLFMDCKNSPDFSDFNSIIYGHNMQNGSMFADVTKFESEEFFKNHSYGWLTTEDEVQLIDFFAVARITNTSELYLVNLGFEQWDFTLREHSKIYKEIGICADDNLIVLSTCTNSDGNERTILVGKIIKN